MSGLDEILDGLIEALELERELGVRFVEIDRELLNEPRTTHFEHGDSAVPVRGEVRPRAGALVMSRPQEQTRPPVSAASSGISFLIDRPLSPPAVALMAKIVTAMHLAPDAAPILFSGSRPVSRVTVVLGLRALRHWFPGATGSPGQWISVDGVDNILVTYSPEYILRLGAETPAVRELKLGMWRSLKAALQRIGNGT